MLWFNIEQVNRTLILYIFYKLILFYFLSIIYELICYFEFFFVDFSVRFALQLLCKCNTEAIPWTGKTLPIIV